MNTGTPASAPSAPRNSQRTGPRAPRGRDYAKLVSTGRPAGPHTARGLVGSRPAVWLAMAAMLALAMLQGAPPAQAAAGDATGQPGIVDQANPNDTLTTVRPDMTLAAVTTGIMDTDGTTTPNWTYQWIRWDSTTYTNIAEATASTYVVKEDDIGYALYVAVTFTDGGGNAEGPLRSPGVPFVGPTNLSPNPPKRGGRAGWTKDERRGNETAGRWCR